MWRRDRKDPFQEVTLSCHPDDRCGHKWWLGWDLFMRKDHAPCFWCKKYTRWVSLTFESHLCGRKCGGEVFHQMYLDELDRPVETE